MFLIAVVLVTKAQTPCATLKQPVVLEHKALFFRDQKISAEEQLNLAKRFGPLEKHIYVKGRKEYPEIIRIIKEPDEKRQWGETWHTDVSYNPKPTKVIILKSVEVPPVGGDTMFSNMEIAYETLDEKIWLDICC